EMVNADSAHGVGGLADLEGVKVEGGNRNGGEVLADNRTGQRRRRNRAQNPSARTCQQFVRSITTHFSAPPGRDYPVGSGAKANIFERMCQDSALLQRLRQV